MNHLDLTWAQVGKLTHVLADHAQDEDIAAILASLARLRPPAREYGYTFWREDGARLQAADVWSLPHEDWFKSSPRSCGGRRDALTIAADEAQKCGQAVTITRTWSEDGRLCSDTIGPVTP